MAERNCRPHSAHADSRRRHHPYKEETHALSQRSGSEGGGAGRRTRETGRKGGEDAWGGRYGLQGENRRRERIREGEEVGEDGRPPS